MPVVSTMGLKKIYICEAGTTPDTFPTYGNNWKDLGDVYQDTCKLTDDDPEVTEHKSETSTKKITQVGELTTKMDLSLMDPDQDQLTRYFGGSFTGTAGKKVWVRPRKLPTTEFAIWIQPEEGIWVGCSHCRIVPKFEITYSKTGICLVPMSVYFNASLQANEDSKFSPTVVPAG